MHEIPDAHAFPKGEADRCAGGECGGHVGEDFVRVGGEHDAKGHEGVGECVGGVIQFLGVDDVGLDVVPVPRLDAFFDLAYHSGTNIAAFDGDFFARVMVCLAEDLGLSAASTRIIEDPGMGIDGGKQAEELELSQCKGRADCLRDAEYVRKRRRTGFLVLPIDLVGTVRHGDGGGGSTAA